VRTPSSSSRVASEMISNLFQEELVELFLRLQESHKRVTKERTTYSIRGGGARFIGLENAIQFVYDGERLLGGRPRRASGSAYRAVAGIHICHGRMGENILLQVRMFALQAGEHVAQGAPYRARLLRTAAGTMESPWPAEAGQIPVTVD